MNMQKKLLAHMDLEQGEYQLLEEHIFEVSRLAGERGKEIGLEYTCQLVGLLHDFGKYSKEFQNYIRGAYRGRVVHSSSGARIVELLAINLKEDRYNFFSEKERALLNLHKEILQYPILAHHGLYDIIDHDLEYRTGQRLSLENDKELELLEEEALYLNYIDKEYINRRGKNLDELFYLSFQEFEEIYKKIGKMGQELPRRKEEKTGRVSVNFYLGALVRLILSILKEADVYDSSNYFRGDDKDKLIGREELDRVWGEGQKAIENLYQNFEKKESRSELDLVRSELADEIATFSSRYPKGNFKLSMTVGSGKTYASLRYALVNAKKFKKNRIIYCTAFLSVLEQNAGEIKKVLGEKGVFEHHSNILEDRSFQEGEEDAQDGEEYYLTEYLKESWESPIILTSLVQFYNSLFKGRSQNLRRFSKLINSVIIIDEIQSLPTKALYLSNLMLNFLAEIMNCNIVHCTATQPKLDDREVLFYPVLYGFDQKDESIVPKIEKKEVFDRVSYYSLLGEKVNQRLESKEILEHLKKELEESDSVLFVCNSKRAVRRLYDQLKADDDMEELELIYLTTNMCPQHRLEIIERMKSDLRLLRQGNRKKKIICVSTKLVEAGVDLDFDTVYRSIAGLDSIIQAAGRCNREGKKEEKGRLYIFEYEEDRLDRLKELREGRDASQAILLGYLEKKNPGERAELDLESLVDLYFRKLYMNVENGGKSLKYPLSDSETILEFLSDNKDKEKHYKQAEAGNGQDFILKQSFKSAASKFELIKEDTSSIIVPYKNKNQLEALHQAIEIKDYRTLKKILKSLQPSTISVRRSEIDKYRNYIFRELDGELLILSQEAYDKEIGLKIEELQSLIF